MLHPTLSNEVTLQDVMYNLLLTVSPKDVAYMMRDTKSFGVQQCLLLQCNISFILLFQLNGFVYDYTTRLL